MKIYLAGPEVFLHDAKEIGVRKKEICSRYGCEGLFPLDNTIDLSKFSRREAGFEISRQNENLIRGCDAVIANLTPFRGPSADVGTVYELALGLGLGKRVIAYSNDPRLYREKVRSMPENAGLPDGGKDWLGHEIEDFDLTDNLMLEGGLLLRGSKLVLATNGVPAGMESLVLFERCVQILSGR